jgi:hypothetical protein
MIGFVFNLTKRRKNMSTNLYKAVEEIISLMSKDTNSSFADSNAWDKLVYNIDPNGTVPHKFTLSVEKAVKKHLSNMTDEDKRSIWKETEIGQGPGSDEGFFLISSIEMDLHEELFEQVIEIAFEGLENQKH